MVNFIYWDEMDPDDPFRSLARKTLLSPGYCPVSVRANLTAERMRQGDGVIAFYPKIVPALSQLGADRGPVKSLHVVIPDLIRNP
jgi:hypothetical protein